MQRGKIGKRISNQQRGHEVNRNEKIQALYNDLMSSEFTQLVEAIIEAASAMRQNIDKERKSMLVFLKKQEKRS